jgi:hypothetical protein
MRNGTGSIGLDAKRAGYRTLFLGKWHVQGIEENLIGRLGFDQWVATENTINFDAPCFCEETMCQDIDSRNQCQQTEACSRKRSMCFAPSFDCAVGHLRSKSKFRSLWFSRGYGLPNRSCAMSTLGIDGKVIDADIPSGKMPSEILVDRFESFVGGLAKRDAFLAMLSFQEVHWPHIADPVKRNECEAGSATCTTTATTLKSNSVQSNYFSNIESLDAAVGRVRDILKGLDRERNTLVLFTSDNGPSRRFGSAFPLKGKKLR